MRWRQNETQLKKQQQQLRVTIGWSKVPLFEPGGLKRGLKTKERTESEWLEGESSVSDCWKICNIVCRFSRIVCVCHKRSCCKTKPSTVVRIQGALGLFRFQDRDRPLRPPPPFFFLFEVLILICVCSLSLSLSPLHLLNLTLPIPPPPVLPSCCSLFNSIHQNEQTHPGETNTESYNGF